MGTGGLTHSQQHDRLGGMSLRQILLLFLLTGILPAGAQSSSGVAAQPETPEQKWSKRQMSHMLADRPVMKTYVVGSQILWISQQDSLWQWVAERYAGKTTKFWTAWHEAPPADNSGAMHAYGQDKAYLYLEDLKASVAGGHNEIFEELWSRTVFELLNLENAAGFSEAASAAYEGTCSRNEFVRQYAALEHLALGKLQRFHTDVWVPWCKTSGFVSNPAIWKHDYLPDFETWLGQYPSDSWYPWQDYGGWYDRVKSEREQKSKQSQAPVK